MKKSPNSADISFDIMDEDDLGSYAGKEQLAKTSRRISEFLMDIKRVGWTFKGVLEHHNARRERTLAQQNHYGWILCAKVAAMIAIVGLQVVAVKRIFN